MFSSQGVSLSDVGDIELFAHGDELHLFHLTLPNHDVVQHLMSTDGLSWKRLPNAIRTGEPGDADDDQIWTMSVTERDGRYYMLYTALSLREHGRVQRTNLAISDDLIRWEKVAQNPVGEADPRWYETAPDTKGMVSWRDPKPIKIGDAYFAAVCARENSGPFMRRGVVGLLESPDLVKWESRPPLFAPRRWWDLECPQVFELGGHFYLTAGIMEDRTQRYWVADRFEGPYTVPADGGILAPLGHYAGRVCEWRGQTIYGCWHQPNPRSIDGPVAQRVDWATVRNPHGKFMMPPLVLEPRADGSLARRSFSGWGALSTGASELTPLTHSLAFEQPIADWTLDTPPGSFDIVASNQIAGDLKLDGTLTLDAASGGIVFRLDDDGSGYFVTVQPGSTSVSLRKWLPTEDRFDQRPWFSYITLQEGTANTALDWNAGVPFTLISVGPYIELALNGEVVLATLSGERLQGRIGFWAESGSVRASHVTLDSMVMPLPPD
jgi:beta-fructofuranosidase